MMGRECFCRLCSSASKNEECGGMEYGERIVVPVLVGDKTDAIIYECVYMV